MTFPEAIQFLLPHRSRPVGELVGNHYHRGKTKVYHNHFLQMHSERYLGIRTYVPPYVKRTSPSVAKAFWEEEVGRALLAFGTHYGVDRDKISSALLTAIREEKTLEQLLKDLFSFEFNT